MTRLLRPALALLLVTAACRPRPVVAVPTPPAASVEWPSVLAQALSEAGAQRYAGADRLLTDFATRFPGAPESAETAFYRAMLRLDPQNPSSSRSEAAQLLDAYLGGSATIAHRFEASAVKRLLASSDARVAAAREGSAAKPADVPANQDAEVARLKDELARANAELERIRRRVAKP